MPAGRELGLTPSWRVELCGAFSSVFRADSSGQRLGSQSEHRATHRHLRCERSLTLVSRETHQGGKWQQQSKQRAVWPCSCVVRPLSASQSYKANKTQAEGCAAQSARHLLVACRGWGSRASPLRTAAPVLTWGPRGSTRHLPPL